MITNPVNFEIPKKKEREFMSQHMASLKQWIGDPFFVVSPLRVCGAPADDNRTFKLWGADDRGGLALTADAKLA